MLFSCAKKSNGENEKSNNAKSNYIENARNYYKYKGDFYAIRYIRYSWLLRRVFRIT